MRRSFWTRRPSWAETTAGPRLLDTAALRAVLCDARISRPGQPNRQTIPPGLRRRALERDRYRCRARGCGRNRFLNVHHLRAKADGGAHRLDIVLTLCNPCHTLVHARPHAATEAWVGHGRSPGTPCGS